MVDVTFTMTSMSVVSDRLLGHGMGSMASRSAGRGMHVLMRHWMSHLSIVLIFMFGLRLVHGVPLQIAFIPFLDPCHFLVRYGFENTSACTQALAAQRCGSLAAGIATLQTHNSTKLSKVPPRTHAEGNQVEPVLGGVYYLSKTTAIGSGIAERFYRNE
jgi:hypothetical protein